MRTLVISDLHLGARLGRDVLRRPVALDALVAALDGIDRLVLLGDAVELLEHHRRPRPMLEVAQPVLRRIAAALPAGAEILMVPGNHDAELVRPWLRANGVPDAADAPIPLDATPLLREVTSWLAPADVRVHYPGVWLSDRVYATHGHYLDRHLLPVTAYGVARGLLGGQPRDRAVPRDYEEAGGPSFTSFEAFLTRWLPRPLAALADDLAEALRASTMPARARKAHAHRLAPLTALVLGLQMQRASLPALARVVRRLGVDAEFVLFGHVHRLGPLPGDDPARWLGPGGGPRILNTGAWTYEPLLLHRAAPPHPYWPGGAVVIDDAGDAGGVPRTLGLLDHLSARALH